MASVAGQMDMVDIICAPSYMPGEIAFMDEKIAQFLENYHEILEATLRPKEHFTLHCATLTKLCAPLILCSTITCGRESIICSNELQSGAQTGKTPV